MAWYNYSMNKICKINACGTPIGRHGARGMCPYHYKRDKANIPFDQPKRGTFVRRCSYSECDNKHYGNGFCQTHYWRNKSIGGLNGSMRIPRASIASDSGDYTLIPLGANARQGYALVDNKFKYLEEYQWSLGKKGYAITNIDRKQKYLHHFILQPVDALVVNHKNENKLDNRANNLELVERWKNNTFKSTFKTGNTGVRGIYLDSRPLKKPYQAQIRRGDIKRKEYFATLDEAIDQRKEWEIELFGRLVT